MIDNDGSKETALLVSTPGIIRDATTIMLESIPQLGDVELVSGSLSAIERLQNGKSYFLLVIDANLPVEETVSLVRWSKQHRPNTRCIVLAKGLTDLEHARTAGADAVFLRSRSARDLVKTLWPDDLA